MADKPFHLLTAAQISAMKESAHVHQFNDNAIRQTKHLSDLLGLSTMGVHLVRLEPGRESTQFHYHHQDEEFVYILSGRARAEIGDDEVEVGPGDFMAFPMQSEPHSLKNTFDEDVVYLMGGTRSDIDVCDYPRINKRMVRVNGNKSYADMDDIHDLP